MTLLLKPQAELEDKVPSGQLALEEECRGLAELSLAEVEMPGLYLAGHDVTPDSVVMLESFGANIAIVRRHCTSYRRLVMFGSDGRARHMLVRETNFGCGFLAVIMDLRTNL